MLFFPLHSLNSLELLCQGWGLLSPLSYIRTISIHSYHIHELVHDIILICLNGNLVGSGTSCLETHYCYWGHVSNGNNYYSCRPKLHFIILIHARIELPEFSCAIVSFVTKKLRVNLSRQGFHLYLLSRN